MTAVDVPVRAAGLGGLGVRLVPSALADRLPGHPDALRAFKAARHRFLASERIDMSALAAELGVDRTSLFRWVGNRDALLAEILWSLAAPTFDAADAEAPGGGADRVAGALTRFVADLISAAAFRAWLTREPARALRILTTGATCVHARFLAVTESMLAEELAAGRMRSPLPPHDLATVLVRVLESYAYADVVAGEEPDADRAAAAFALVLAATRTAP